MLPGGSPSARGSASTKVSASGSYLIAESIAGPLLRLRAASLGSPAHTEVSDFSLILG